MRLIGIDYGSKRVGIALSDEEGKFAMPHSVLLAGDTLIPNIKSLCEQEKVGAVVLGLSQDFNNKDNPIMKKINIFKKKLEEVMSLPVYFETEVLTSAEAERIQGKSDMHDASAAALILKSYIDRKNYDINR